MPFFLCSLKDEDIKFHGGEIIKTGPTKKAEEYVANSCSLKTHFILQKFDNLHLIKSKSAVILSSTSEPVNVLTLNPISWIQTGKKRNNSFESIITALAKTLLFPLLTYC